MPIAIHKCETCKHELVCKYCEAYSESINEIEAFVNSNSNVLKTIADNRPIFDITVDCGFYTRKRDKPLREGAASFYDV